MKGGRDSDVDLVAFGLRLVAGLLWLAHDVRRDRRIVQRGQVEVERFLKAEAEGWR